MPSIIPSILSSVFAQPLSHRQGSEQHPEIASSGSQGQRSKGDSAVISSAGYQALATAESQGPDSGSVQQGAKSSVVSAASDSDTQYHDHQHDEDEHAAPNRQQAANGERLSIEEEQALQQLQARDREVRAHEQAHLAAAGGLARGTIGYRYERGADGRQYAVAGEVRIDTAPIADDPEATLRKMAQVRRAALAPAQPSSADRAIASRAAQHASRAQMELAEQQRSDPEEEANDNQADSAQRVNRDAREPQTGQQAFAMNMLWQSLMGSQAANRQEDRQEE